MKIGLIVNSPSPHQVELLDAVADIDGANISVVYAYPRNPQRSWGAPKTKATHAELPWPPRWGFLDSLEKWFEGLGCDVWIVGSVITSPRTHVAWRVLASMRVPVAFLGEPPRPRSGWKAWIRDRLLRSILKRCDGVVATGKDAARRYSELVDEQRPVASVPYYIPLEDWLALPLMEPPNKKDPIRFVTLAQLIPRKGIDVLIRACGRLPQTGWRLDIYGEGSCRADLQQLIDLERLPITLHEPLPFAERTNALQGMHCFVFPTRWDGWGMVIPEALAAGLPVISTDQAMSAHDFIEPGKQGWIGPAESEVYLIERMKEVMNHPDRLRAMSHAARASVASYRPEQGAKRLLAFAGELSASKGVKR